MEAKEERNRRDSSSNDLLFSFGSKDFFGAPGHTVEQKLCTGNDHMTMTRPEISTRTNW
jgi:hypothetical protein